MTGDAPAARGSVVLQGVSRRFGSVTAVDRLDLAARSGEFLSILGPSGCGKTTTLRMLAGFERPDMGRVWLDGEDVTDRPPYRRDINTVFQHYALFPHMTVAGNVAYGLRQRGASGDRLRTDVQAALEMVAMESMMDRRPHELSGGQQQRVALARALVNRPAVLLLDEPLGALDRALRDRMQHELKRLQLQLGMTFVYVTHDQDEALHLSDRIAVMEAGRLVQLGAPEEVYDRPATAFVAGFVGRQNFLQGCFGSDGRSLRGDAWVVEAEVDDGFAPNSRGVAAIRPEAIDVTTDRMSPGANVLEGIVAGRAVLGDSTQLVIDVKGGVELMVRRTRRDLPLVALGATVWCRWSRASVRLFECSGATERPEGASESDRPPSRT
jgi:spermidine/putrescine transport system ATP-binding protein